MRRVHGWIVAEFRFDGKQRNATQRSATHSAAPAVVRGPCRLPWSRTQRQRVESRPAPPGPRSPVQSRFRLRPPGRLRRTTVFPCRVTVTVHVHVHVHVPYSVKRTLTSFTRVSLRAGLRMSLHCGPPPACVLPRPNAQRNPRGAPGREPPWSHGEGRPMAMRCLIAPAEPHLSPRRQRRGWPPSFLGGGRPRRAATTWRRGFWAG